jgi:N6-adenosine-specific RNA methylase IME4
MIVWPFGNLRPFSYDLLMVDPPWAFSNWSEKGERKNAKAHYSCMSVDDIKALPVGHLASPDAVCILWATNPLLRQAFEVLDAWGFAFKTAAHWVKRTSTGKLAFGTGYLLRCAGEPILIGAVGEPKTSKRVRSIIEGPVREHSRKPDEAFAWAEALMPEARRVELFSRQSRAGWDSWGNETGKFDAEAAE